MAEEAPEIMRDADWFIVPVSLRVIVIPRRRTRATMLKMFFIFYHLLSSWMVARRWVEFKVALVEAGQFRYNGQSIKNSVF